MDEGSVVIRGDIPINTIINTEIRIITNKVNIPDKYYEDRRKLKIFII